MKAGQIAGSGILVGIIMGSKSDLEVMRAASGVLKEFSVDCEMKVISAHRAPKLLADYAQGAAGRGIEVLICGAGGAAHLPGITAALTRLPVLGVPVESKALRGLDSLLSIVQMPSGVPVATVGIDSAKNAGLLALRILSVKYPQLAEKMDAYRATLEKQVRETVI